jgi:hypothetical protein
MTLKEEVFNLLKNYPRSRNSDYALYHYYLEVYRGVSTKDLTVHELFIYISGKKFPNIETLGRLRRAIQEECASSVKFSYICGDRNFKISKSKKQKELWLTKREVLIR